MAATDTFRHFNDSLRPEVRKSITDFMRENAEELLAARSEDARNRIVEAYIKEVHRLTKNLKSV